MTSSHPPATTIGKRTRPLTPRRGSSMSTGINTSNISSPSSPSSSSSPETKIARSSRSPDISHSSIDNPSADGRREQRPILCTLPPTCNRHPITLSNSKELERHYATYHAHVCEQPGCGCVFPEARLLELHQTECHDPLAAVRKERGEKIFGCMVTTCTRFFQSPKARRLHMIEAHKYPKEFFFSVTNKGIGGLLKKWGEGASMIRGEWKPRKDDDTKEGNTGEKSIRDIPMAEDDDDNDEEASLSEEVEEVDMEDLERTPKPRIQSLHPASPPSSVNVKTSTSADIDAIAEGMNTLALVPNSIRFGRGGHGGGLGGRGRGGRGGIVPPRSSAQSNGKHQRSASTSSVTDVKQQLSAGGTAGTGGRVRGGRRGKSHRTTASVGTGVEMEVSAEQGGDVVLLPPAGASGERGHGRRGKKGSKIGAL